jgi:hypothetical protein
MPKSSISRPGSSCGIWLTAVSSRVSPETSERTSVSETAPAATRLFEALDVA